MISFKDSIGFEKNLENLVNQNKMKKYNKLIHFSFIFVEKSIHFTFNSRLFCFFVFLHNLYVPEMVVAY